MSCAVLSALAAGCRTTPIELFRTDGDISRAGTGWTYQASSAKDGVVYIPFEGHYPDKGGRLQSTVFSLGKTNDLPGYYRLQFKATSAKPCYWWLDYLDQNDQLLPDCNSALYRGDTYRSYDQVVYVMGAVRKMQVAFVSQAKVQASDVRVTPATADEAAHWCDTVYKALPPLKFSAPPDSMKRLPKTTAALKSGTPWRVVMLGDSIINDSFNSTFQALIKRDFPKSSLEFIVSVRGSTGCPWYRQPAEFKSYVADHKPDLLMIGGISNFAKFDDDEKAALAEVIKMAREQLGCEILIISQPLSADWRKNEVGATDWRQLVDNPKHRRCLDSRFHQEIAQKTSTVFWDMTTPCHDYLAAAGDISFSRDAIHNDDRGKQIIGRIMAAYFRTAQ